MQFIYTSAINVIIYVHISIIFIIVSRSELINLFSLHFVIHSVAQQTADLQLSLVAAYRYIVHFLITFRKSCCNRYLLRFQLLLNALTPMLFLCTWLMLQRDQQKSF